MSSTVATKQHAPRLSFFGVLRSEAIKLLTLRSTFWCCLIVVVLSIGFGLLLSTIHPPHIAGAPVAPAPTHAQQQATAVQDATVGTGIGQLVFAVLGVLVISGEYATGMIRSTFAAVPKRLPALFAKAIVLAITSFVVGLVTIYLTAAIIFPLLPGLKVHPDWGDWKLNESLLGAAVYLAIISLIAFCIGAIIRNSAGGIATALGLILVLPAVLEIVAATTQATWARNIASVLPTAAGGHLYTYVVGTVTKTSGVISLDRTSGGLIMIGWFVALFIVAAALLKERDA
jgi:ABC-2 type transport system permease protein